MMRRWAVGMSAALLMLAAAGCQRGASAIASPQGTALNPATTPGSPDQQVSFKGMELYSLRATDGRWHYYVVAGTNRQKRLSEVTAASPAIGIESAKSYLRSLPPGSSLVWNMPLILDRPGMGNPMMPDVASVQQIQAVCRQSGIDLALAQ